MKNLIMVCGLAAGSAWLLNAQSSVPLSAEIPFAFHVGDTPMPAGEYLVTKAATVTIRVSDMAGGHAALLKVIPNGGGKPAERCALVFRKYGNDRYFLGEIRHAGDNVGSWVPQSKVEKEAVTSTLVTSAKPLEVVIFARAR